MTKGHVIRNTLLAIFACVLWSTAFVGVKYGLQFAQPFVFAGVRFMMSGFMLLPFCGSLHSYIRTFRKHFVSIFMISLFQTFLLYAFFYVGMTMVSGALGAIVIGASPLTIAVAAHFVMPDDRMTLVKTFSLLLGLIGVMVISISRQPWQAQGLREFVGVVILLGGGISSAAGNIAVARERYRIDPIVLNSIQIFLGGFMLFIVSLLVEGFPRMVYPPMFYGALVYLAALSAIAFSIWFGLLKQPQVKVSELNLWKFIIPVCGALLAWALLPDESPEVFAIIGMVCVTCAILFYHIAALRVQAKKKRNGY
ncbi:DMT family transporter [candidate division WOR-3 bacterium]|nr:DMT family transporter [candidate division WOR-3 bacterium]